MARFWGEESGALDHGHKYLEKASEGYSNYRITNGVEEGVIALFLVK
jgi:hypothetical protein